MSSSADRQDESVNSCLIKLEAEHLVDELFQQLEQDLQQSQALSAELVNPHPSTHPLPGTATARSVRNDDLLVSYAPISAPATHRHRFLNPAAAPSVPAEDPSTIQRGNDFLLYALAGTSVVISIALWASSQIYWQKMTAITAMTATVAPPVEATPSINPADAEFAQYIQRALEIIQQQPDPAQQPVVASATGLPTVKVPPGSPAGKRPGNVERIYIPVYQPSAAQPATAAPPSVQPLPQPPQLPVALKPAAGTPTAANIQPLAGKKPVDQILVGVLELGDRSVALVQVNGSTERVALGQPVGTSGWKLRQIVDQKAVVERGGEVRSIFVGQQF
uniref:Type II secretion system protein GspC N-terminal domain-containing protein n=1 Tax=Cyanothece sp. (strain PCC 7425 / ATCC 29141) TaxID=395961 RepID=B8HML1_CYAP4